MADSAYERSDYQVMHGNDFKALYGNREKVEEASNKSIYLFSEIADRLPILGLSIVETAAGSCDISGGDCISVGTYVLESENDDSTFVYLWSIDSGNATIDSDATEAQVIISTLASSVNETFTVKCMVIDDMQAQEELSFAFTHIKS